MNDYVEIAKTLFPLGDANEDERTYPWDTDYQPIIDHFGKVLLQVDEEGHSGDSHILYADTGKGFGYLQFGWGSCSGCDALQECSTYEELGELIRDLESSIRWASRDDLLRFLREHDWEGDWSRGNEQQQFVAAAISFLENITPAVSPSV